MKRPRKASRLLSTLILAIVLSSTSQALAGSKGIAQETCPYSIGVTPNAFPWSSAGALIVATRDKAYLGTAFLISDRLLLTARHNFEYVNPVAHYFNLDTYRQLEGSRLFFVPGTAPVDLGNLGVLRNRSIEATLVELGQGKHPNNDWAILKLERPVSGLRSIQVQRVSDNDLKNRKLRTGGYSCWDGPQKKNFDVFEGQIENGIESYIYGTMASGLGAQRGNSGGPVVTRMENGNWVAVGILTGGSVYRSDLARITLSSHFMDAVEKALREEAAERNAPFSSGL